MEIALTIVSILAQAVTAGLGIRWSLRRPKEPHWAPVAMLVALALTGAISTAVQQNRATRSQASAAADQNAAIERIRSELLRSEAGRQADNVLLRAKLEAAHDANRQLAEFAPAILSLAKTSAEHTRRLYETKVASNDDLRARTRTVVARMLALEAKYQVSRDSIAFSPRPTSATEEDRHRRWDAMTAAYIKASFERDLEFRSTIHADAVWVREELVKRVGENTGEAGPTSFVFDHGALAGAAPLSEAATYLEILARKLSP